MALFESGWESSGGSDNTDGGLWTSVSSNGDTPTVTGSVKNSGLYSCKFSAGTGGFLAGINKTVDSGSFGDQCNLRFYIYFETLPTNDNGNCPIAAIDTAYNGGGYGTRLNIINTGSKYMIALVNNYYATVHTGSTEITSGSMILVELEAHKTSAHKLYIDEVLECETSNGNNNQDFTSISVGLPSYDGTVGNTVNNNASSGNTLIVYVDDVAVDSEYIGPYITPSSTILFSGEGYITFG